MLAVSSSMLASCATSGGGTTSGSGARPTADVELCGDSDGLAGAFFDSRSCFHSSRKRSRSDGVTSVELDRVARFDVDGCLLPPVRLARFASGDSDASSERIWSRRIWADQLCDESLQCRLMSFMSSHEHAALCIGVTQSSCCSTRGEPPAAPLFGATTLSVSSRSQSGRSSSTADSELSHAHRHLLNHDILLSPLIGAEDCPYYDVWVELFLGGGGGRSAQRSSSKCYGKCDRADSRGRSSCSWAFIYSFARADAFRQSGDDYV